MKLIKKVWFRVIHSLIIGGMFSEMMHIKTGDSAIITSNKYVFTVGFISYISLTGIILLSNYLTYYKGYSKPYKDEDVLDN